MKNLKVLFPVILFILLGCAKTPLDIAKREVVKVVKMNLNEPSSYKAVSWGKLDSAFAEPMDIITNKNNDQVYQDPVNSEWYILHPERIVKMDGNSLIQGLLGRWYYLNFTKIYTHGEKQPKLTKNQIAYELKRRYAQFKDLDNKEVLRRFLQAYSDSTDNIDTVSNMQRIFIGYRIKHTFRIQGKKNQTKLARYLFTLGPSYNYISHKEEDIEALDEQRPTSGKE